MTSMNLTKKLKRFSSTAFTLMIWVLISACAKETFTARKTQDTSQVPFTFASSNQTCANFTLVRPEVDFLFLWDNSSSQLFVNDATRQALANTINMISTRFDYHVMLAPLIINSGDSIDKDSYLLSLNNLGLSGTALTRKITSAQAPNVLSTYTTSSNSEERGVERAYNIINANRSNGIFRQNAYTIVVLMSNGNDQRMTSNGFFDPVATGNYLNGQKANFTNLKDNLLHSTQMRFISIVAHTACQAGYRAGSSYISFSDFVYNMSYSSGGIAPSDQTSSTKDSYDICGSNFVHLFDGLNNTVLDTVLAHRYNFWPVSFQESPLTFDPETIRVQKSNGEEYFEVEGPASGDGWRYIGFQTDHPLTFEPYVGENVSAHLIELYGNARVSYPDCLVISTQSPTYYYGYVTMTSKPLVSSIRVRINGVDVPQSSTNGWEYVGFQSSINLKIQGPNNPSNPYAEALPAESRSNVHVLKLNGNAIYSSGASIDVVYDPSGT